MKLTKTRLKEISDRRWEDDIGPLLAHIDALNTEIKALSKVAEYAAILSEHDHFENKRENLDACIEHKLLDEFLEKLGEKR